MNQNTFQAPLVGGVTTSLPQNPQNAAEAVNLRVDEVTKAWTTRVGYEPYRPGQSNWNPFASVGPIYGLHAAQGLANGARQHVLFESDGSLYLAYDATGDLILRELASGRNIPAPTEAGPWFTDTAYGTIITNGVDRPVLVRPWPLGNAAESSSTIEQCIRPFGFPDPPEPPSAYRVNPMDAAALPEGQGGGSTTIWCPAFSSAIADGGRWGLGFSSNTTAAAKNESLYSWSVAFISDTGSESPRSILSSASWQVPATSAGYRHAAALSVPLGPSGTVARKIYRTANYSDDFTSAGDTTLYLVELVRNNEDDLYFDAVRSADLGNPSPVVPTGPLPAPRARYSSLYKGCLFLDGGIDDPYTIYFSAQGLIEQYAADAYLELPSQGGGVTALFNNYASLLVFRENGIDVVQGDYSAGFTVSTISSNIVCKSPKSIQAVPGLGVVFLAQDGVYVITGGLQGGAVQDAINLTEAQDDIIRRITPDCFGKAVSAYSAKEREYHVYFPVDGNDRPNLGLVLHLDRLNQVDGGLSPWTVREGFPVGDITTTANGTLIFGHNTGDEAGAGDEYEKGLFAISRRRQLGMKVVADTLVDGDPPTSKWRSAWNSFGDAQMQKQVSYVTLWLITSGDPTVTVRHYKDFKLTPVEERAYKAQPPDSADLPVFDTALLDAVTYQTSRLVPLRVSTAQMSCAWFSFEIETTEDIVLLGYEVTWTTKGTKVIHGKRA